MRRRSVLEMLRHLRKKLFIYGSYLAPNSMLDMSLRASIWTEIYMYMYKCIHYTRIPSWILCLSIRSLFSSSAKRLVVGRGLFFCIRIISIENDLFLLSKSFCGKCLCEYIRQEMIKKIMYMQAYLKSTLAPFHISFMLYQPEMYSSKVTNLCFMYWYKAFNLNTFS